MMAEKETFHILGDNIDIDNIDSFFDNNPKGYTPEELAMIKEAFDGNEREDRINLGIAVVLCHSCHSPYNSLFINDRLCALCQHPDLQE